MPYRTSWTDQNFSVEFFGEVSATEIDAVNAEFCGDVRFDMVRTSIWDMSRISLLIIEAGEIEYAAAIDKGASCINKTLKGAIVVTDNHVRKLVESYLALSNDLDNCWDTRIVSSMEAAKKWIES